MHSTSCHPQPSGSHKARGGGGNPFTLALAKQIQREREREKEKEREKRTKLLAQGREWFKAAPAESRGLQRGQPRAGPRVSERVCDRARGCLCCPTRLHRDRPPGRHSRGRSCRVALRSCFGTLTNLGRYAVGGDGYVQGAIQRQIIMGGQVPGGGSGDTTSSPSRLAFSPSKMEVLSGYNMS